MNKVSEDIHVHALIFCLHVFEDWPTTMNRLFGPTICLPHKNIGIRLSAIPKVFRICLIFLDAIAFALRVNKGSSEYRFKSLSYDLYRELYPGVTRAKRLLQSSHPSAGLAGTALAEPERLCGIG